MIKNLVLSGCGVKIFLYLGILKYLDEINILKNITRYVGCSAGSLILKIVSVQGNLRIRSLNIVGSK